MIGLLRKIDLLVIIAALSYIVQMVIIPKSITIPIVAIIALYLFIHWYYNTYRNSFIHILPFIKYFGPFYLWATLSVFWTVNTDYSFALIRAMLAFEFGCFVATFARTRESMKKVLWGLILGAIVSAAVVLYNQYMFIGIMRLGCYIYGSAMEFSGGITVACYACIILYKVEQKFSYAILFVLCLIINALSGSRTAILYPIVFLVLVDFLYAQNILKTIRIIVVALVILFAMMIACLNVPTLYNVVGHRIEAMIFDKTNDGSFMERHEMKKFGIELWTRRPIIGWGIHGFAYKYKFVNKLVYSHCDYTELLSCFGIVGALLFYYPYAKILFRCSPFAKARLDYWGSFFLAFLLLNIMATTSSIHFINIKIMMLIALAYNYYLEPEVATIDA